MLDPLVVRLSDSVTIIHGDCRAVLPLACDAVVTDPPYGIGFAAQPTKWQRRAGQKPEGWDDEPADVRGLLALAGCVVIWGGNYSGLPPTRGQLEMIMPDVFQTIRSNGWNKIMPGQAPTADSDGVAITIDTTNGITFGSGPNKRLVLPVRFM
jgi:hypothetical protein